MTSAATAFVRLIDPAKRRGRPIAPARQPTRHKNYRLIKLSQAALFVSVIVSVALAIGWPQFWPSEDRVRIGISLIEDPGKIANDISDLVNVTTDRLQQHSEALAGENMDARDAVFGARFLSIDGNGRPFSITADLIVALDDGSPRMMLTNPYAEMTLDDGSWIALLASSGVYDRSARQVTLVGNVKLFHDSGFEAETNSVVIDLAEMTASGSDPVRAQGPDGIITSDGFRVDQNGERLVFTGNSLATLYPGESGGFQ